MSRWIDNGPVDRLDMVNWVAEDIDIALYRDFFLKEKGVACARCENNNQIKRHRVTMCWAS